MKWLRKILGLCVHKWVDVNKLTIVDYEHKYDGKFEVLDLVMVQNCTVCNDYRRVQT